MSVDLVVISALCTAKGCRRQAVQAVRVSSGFWVTRCAECSGKKLPMDLKRIGAAVDATKRLKGKAV